MVPLRDQHHDVLVGFQILRRIVDKRVKVVKPIKSFACAVGHSTVSCGPHRIEPIPNDDHWCADLFGIVQMLRQKPPVTLWRIEVDIRQDQDAPAFPINQFCLHYVDSIVFLFNGPLHDVYGFGAGGLVAASAMAGAAFSIPRLTT